jgi:L,D-peptidoglycan transpeptidase YkuD (ErfK/YbiS/YcfS/YnhG family)
VALVALGIVAAVQPLVEPAEAGAARPGVSPSSRTLPARIGAPPKVLQMIIVTSPRWSSTTGTLRAWQRPRGGTWSVVHGPLPVALGYAGWVIADQRVQSSGTSPAGRFGLPSAFGLASDPGTALPYRHVDGNDWWPYEPRDPATYNVYQGHRDSHSRWRPDYSEHLADYPGQYDYVVVVGFNLPSGVHYSPKRHQWIARHRAHIHRGGGIFLHVHGSGSTAGCIAMDRSDLTWLLRWLDPARHPQLVMGPYDYVLTL